MSRSLRHTGKIVTAGIALVLLFPSAALADHNGSWGGGGQNGETGVVTVEASTTYLPVGSEGSRGEGCTEDTETTVYIDDDFTTTLTAGFYLTDPVSGSDTIFDFIFSSAAGHTSQTRLFSPTGRWFRYNCGGDYYLLPEGGPAITIGGLVDRVVAQLDPPEPTLAVTPDHGRHAVNMPSWLAVDPTYWDEPRIATATSGRVQVQATLTPTNVEWDLGNGDIQTCDNPGVVWQGYMQETQSTCGYTYTWPSISPPSNTYDLSGTVSFDVSHTTNAPGTYGPWVPVERTTTETIEVVEIQSVNQ
ncbi:MAG: hypothetical protein ACRBK7_19325 [Acidimicrobiales bacterium]